MRYLMPLSAALAGLVLGIAACTPVNSATVAQSNLPRNLNPEVPAEVLRSLVDGNNKLALDLYQALRAQPGNLVFSPYSISSAIAMTYAGARGDTETQMASALHFDLPQDTLHPAFNQLDLSLTGAGRANSAGQQGLQLRIANAVWAEQTLSLLQAYLDVIARNYGAGVRLVDFVKHSEAARQQINEWVSNETQHKIQDLVPEGVLDSSSRMVLVNAIYFKGDWQDQFDPNDTRESSFTLLDGSQVQARLMSEHLMDAPYTAGAGYQAIELPYQGGDAAMDILVPDAGTFDAFQNQLDAERLAAILNGMQPTDVGLRLPKFQFTTEFDLGDRLSALGMRDAFNPDLADFSGMTGHRDLFVSKVLHKAFVAVDEKGTEAAAATSVIMAPTTALLPQVSLTVDRPFLFVLRDLGSQQILFVGRVLDPTR